MHDYAGGKADWAVHGLPLEGRTAGRRRVIDVARKDIPTCGPRERLGDVRGRVRAAGHDVCIVVNERGIVLGRLRRDCWEREKGYHAMRRTRNGSTPPGMRSTKSRMWHGRVGTRATT